jgi:uncharacterized membrane protein YraQ (UPF0718 family)
VSILLGLGGGWVAAIIESRGWLASQTRFAQTPTPAPACTCSQPSKPGGLSLPLIPILQAETSCCMASEAALVVAPASFACVSMPVEASKSKNQPASCACASTPVDTVQSKNKPAGVTLIGFLKELLTAGKTLLTMFVGFAFVGYFLNGLIPTSWMSALFGSGKVYTMIDNGMSQGAALAFMISGARTSIGVIAGPLTIARWRVISLVVGALWIGAILCGLAFNWLLML